MLQTSHHVNLHSHPLPDSDSDLQSDPMYSQLSAISSQPSLAELSRPASPQALQAGALDGSLHGGYSPNASTIGPGTSSSSSIVLHDIPQVTDQGSDEQEVEGAGSLKADSVLLDTWATPFGASPPQDRYIESLTFAECLSKLTLMTIKAK